MTGERNAQATDNGDSKKVRVYVDGCFDLIHFGHANALRQARALGDQLLVGVCGDAEIVQHKGIAPILHETERAAVISSLRWVDEVLPSAPYVLTATFTEELFSKHDVDLIVHGDDPCVDVNGQDAYAYAKQMGKFRVIKRTEGISSTNILDRILHPRAADEHKSFLLTARRVALFSPRTARASQQPAVYVAGTFDLFHPGHVDFLQRVRRHFPAAFVVAAVVRDDHCVMSVYERSMMVLACSLVDDVVIDGPLDVTRELAAALGITAVVSHEVDARVTADGIDVSRIDTEADKGTKTAGAVVVDGAELRRRVADNRVALQERAKRKKRSEADYVERHKQFVEER